MPGNKFRTIFSRQFRQSRRARLCGRGRCGAMLTRLFSSALVMKHSPHSNHNLYQPASRTICGRTDGSAPAALHRCRNPNAWTAYASAMLLQLRRGVVTSARPHHYLTTILINPRQRPRSRPRRHSSFDQPTRRSSAEILPVRPALG